MKHGQATPVQAMRRHLDAASGASGALPKMHVATVEPALQAETKMRYATIAMSLLLSGCAGLNANPQMSAEQLKAVASDSNANATVVVYTGAGGQGIFSTVNTDKGALGVNGGSVTVKPTGEIEIVVNPRKP